MAFTANIPQELTCPEDDIFSLPTKEDLVNSLSKIGNIPSQLKIELQKLKNEGGLTEQIEEEVKKVIKDIEDFIEGFSEILSPFWQKGTIRNWEKEINDAITELLQEFQIFVPAKIAEIISKIIPIGFKVNILGIEIDVLKILEKEEQQRIKTQIAGEVDKFFALIPDTFKGFDGKLGLICDEWKANVTWQYIKTKIQQFLSGNLHGAFSGLIDKFDEIWDALGLPGLPDLLSFDVAGLIDAIVDRLVEQRNKLLEKLDDPNLSAEARQKILDEIQDVNSKITEGLESISIGGFSLRDIIGGAIDKTVQSIEETVTEIRIALEDFVYKLTQKLLFDWVKIVKKFFDAIGLGKIFKILFFTFCDLLKLIGMPFNLNVAIPTIAGVMVVKKLPKKQSLKKRSFTRDRGVSFFNADGSESEFELPPESGSRLIFIDGKKDKIGLEDGGNLLLETNEIGPSGLGSADKLSLEEATSGVSVVGNNIVFETPPTNGQTVSIVNV